MSEILKCFKRKENKKVYSEDEKEAIFNIKRFAKTLVLAVLAVLVCFVFVFGVYVQKGTDMYPRIRDGDLIFFFRLDKSHVINDVLTYEVDGKRYTGRYVAMEGDVVDINEKGQLLVNGNVQIEEVYYPTFKMGTDIVYPYKVPEDHLFMLGDFRTNATDSRSLGAIQQDDIDGKVITFIRRRGI